MITKIITKVHTAFTFGSELFKGHYVQSKHLVRDVALLRHAQSDYNVASSKYLEENQIQGLTWDEICQIEDFNLDINFNKKFIDCDLSPKGAIQCYEVKQKYQAQPFDYDLILVSPLLRALRTCRYIFNYFPIKKVVLPQLTEAFRYSCDISHDIDEKMQEFKDFDFSRFQKGDNFWFLDTQSKQTQQLILKRIADKQLQNYEEIQFQILMMMYQGKIYESDYHVRIRAQKIKNIIAEYRKHYNKVIVISHHYMIQNLLAKGYLKNHQPIIPLEDEVPNATPLLTSLHQLLSVR